MARFAVRLQRGGPWDFARGMRDQVDWDAHAQYMDRLVEAGFVVLGGPLEGEREVLLIIEAESADAARDRLAEDPWAPSGMLRPISIERWTVLLERREGD
jgi:uncharacterized protein YciI